MRSHATIPYQSFSPRLRLAGHYSVQRLTRYIPVPRSMRETINISEISSFKRKPPARRGKFIQLKYITQTEVAPPTFMIFSNHPQLLEKSYVAYVSNQLRARYSFDGVPIRVKFRK